VNRGELWPVSKQRFAKVGSGGSMGPESDGLRSQKPMKLVGGTDGEWEKRTKLQGKEEEQLKTRT